MRQWLKRIGARVGLGLALMTLIMVPPAAAQQDEPDDAPFVTGLNFEAEQVYRSFPTVETYRAFLPPRVDLSLHMPPVGSQGSQSSCVAWATSYGARGYYENRRLGLTSNNSAPPFSPAFIYNQIKEEDEDCDAGTMISDALNLMKRVGTVPMADFPYDPRRCKRQPDAKLASSARDFRIQDWKKLEAQKLDDIKGQLYAGNPVIIGMLVNDAFTELKGDRVFSDNRRNGGGHAMVVVGYDDQKQAFKLFNSWGRKWGDQGYGWVAYDAFRTRTRSAFVMQVAAAPPAPPPAPRPTPATPTEAPKPAPKPTPKPVVSPPPADPARVNTLLESVGCADLRANRDDGGRWTVQGVVGAATDRDRVMGKLRDELGIAEAKLDLTVMPWPQCEAYKTFSPALGKSAGLSLRIRGANGNRPTLLQGEPLVLDVTVPSFPSHLYIIYLQAGGDAVFLHTPAANGGRSLPAGSSVILGDGREGRPAFTIGAPYGDEMILAIASPQPLFTSEPDQSMTEREFLTLFRRALLGHGARALGGSDMAAASYIRLVTRAR